MTPDDRLHIAKAAQEAADYLSFRAANLARNFCPDAATACYAASGAWSIFGQAIIGNACASEPEPSHREGMAHYGFEERG